MKSFFRFLYQIYFRFTLDYILHFILENFLDSGMDGWILRDLGIYCKGNKHWLCEFWAST